MKQMPPYHPPKSCMALSTEKRLNLTPAQTAPTYHEAQKSTAWSGEVCTASPGPSHSEFRAAQLKGGSTLTRLFSFYTAILNRSCKQPITSLHPTHTHTHITHAPTTPACITHVMLPRIKTESVHKQAPTGSDSSLNSLYSRSRARSVHRSISLFMLLSSTVKMQRNTWQETTFFLVHLEIHSPPRTG